MPVLLPGKSDDNQAVDRQRHPVGIIWMVSRLVMEIDRLFVVLPDQTCSVRLDRYQRVRKPADSCHFVVMQRFGG
jgi:hypothetical protein